jgi:hypothetical protein
MKTIDRRYLCAALGFTAVILQKDDKRKDGIERASRLATLIDAFCQQTLLAMPTVQQDNSPWDSVIEKLKSDLRTDGAADLEKNRPTLLALYERLLERYLNYATDDMIANRVLELLDWELDYNDKPSL